MPTALLDVDGLLANFVQGMIDSHGLNITHDDWKSWNYHRERGISDQDFWAPTYDGDWWANLPVYDHAAELFKEIQERAEVIFCTAPSYDYKCPSQKVSWLRDCRFMGAKETNYVITRHKHLMAGSGAILIDDSDSNVEAYCNAGGKAILVPQPWNKGRNDISSRVKCVLDYLDDLLI